VRRDVFYEKRKFAQIPQIRGGDIKCCSQETLGSRSGERSFGVSDFTWKKLSEDDTQGKERKKGDGMCGVLS